MRLKARRPSAAIVWWSWWMSCSDGWKTASGRHSSHSADQQLEDLLPVGGEGADVEVVDVEQRLRDPELGRRLAHLARERVGREPLRKRARRDGERDVAHLGAALDEPRDRPAGAELAVVGVRCEDEDALPAVDHLPSPRQEPTTEATPMKPHVSGSSKNAS